MLGLRLLPDSSVLPSTFEAEGLLAESSQPRYGSNDEEASRNEGEVAEEEDDDANTSITLLTRRLRCLFGLVTFPIVPLGTLVALALVWLLYAAYLLDRGQNCSHPLHVYANVSLGLVLYAPNHAKIRNCLDCRGGGGDTTDRPPPPWVKRWDQVFHSFCLIYVYAGILLVQTCRNDVNNNSQSIDSSSSTCHLTCPHLHAAMEVYVATLEIFLLSLVLPILCLPCLYLWFLRHASSNTEALALLQDQISDQEAIIRHGNVSTNQLLRSCLEHVKLWHDPIQGLVVLPWDSNDLRDAQDANDNKECCICMEGFVIESDIETGYPQDEQSRMVRTIACRHLFHEACIASWVGGRWVEGDPIRRRARRTTCPLCRQDLRKSNS